MINKEELESMLLEKDCVKRIAEMTKKQLADTFGYEFSILKDYDQNNPHHHLDLLSHSLTVLRSVLGLELATDDKLCLALAALMHDIGKPLVAKCKGERIVYYDHPIAGRPIADKLLQAYKFPENIIRRVLFLIGYHDAFISFKLPHEINYNNNPYLKPISRSSVGEQLQCIRLESESKYQYSPTPKDFQLLMKLCIADVIAQADIVYQNGRVIDTRKNKLERIHHIEVTINSILSK